MDDDITTLDREIEESRAIEENTHYSFYNKIGESYVISGKSSPRKPESHVFFPVSLSSSKKQVQFYIASSFRQSFLDSELYLIRELKTYKPSALERLITDSKYIYSLTDGWDGEEAEIISKGLWITVTKFLRKYYEFIENELGIKIPLPDINPVRDGSIDLEWHTERGRLLINFSDKRPTAAAYYGDKHKNIDSKKGTTDTSQIEPLLASWMAESL